MEPKIDIFDISKTEIAQFLSTLWIAKLIDHGIWILGFGNVDSHVIIPKDR